MNFERYEEIKFTLAEMIRVAEHAELDAESDVRRKSEIQTRWRDLTARLAEDRFTVVVAGRFSRGKSSLMNAILGVNRLPTGIVPLTSVITYVGYGSKERAIVKYESSSLTRDIRLDELPEYVTQGGNPGNVKRIKAVEIQLPAEVLRRGLFFVDTPGLGSAILENTRSTERFIPEIDLLLLVTSFDSPMSDDEIQFLKNAVRSVRSIFVVLNKHDLVSSDHREEVIEYVSGICTRVLGDRFTDLFSVSARDGLKAKASRDSNALRPSGLEALEKALFEFLIENRANLFLHGMLDRIKEQLHTTANVKRDDLWEQIRSLQASLAATETPAVAPTGQSSRPRPIAPCSVCGAMVHSVLDFLRTYQYELSERLDIQQEHADRGGFCPIHTWQYEQISSPRGVCTGYPKLLQKIAHTLHSGELPNSMTGGNPACPACEVRDKAEKAAVLSLASKWKNERTTTEASPSIPCLVHFWQLIEGISDSALRKPLVERQAQALERVAEDMQRYAMKHDGLRRYLASREELDSALIGLQLIVGHRNLAFVRSITDIL